jgi:hypothetical protein
VADDRISIEIAVDGNADVRLKQIGDAAASFEAKGTKAAFNFQKAWETAAGVVGGLAIYDVLKKVGETAVHFFESMVVDGVKAAEAYEVSVNRLNVALAQSGNFSQETSKAFQEFALHIQQTTKFSEDAVLSSAALIETLTKLKGEPLKQATQGTIDLAAALNIDLESASSIVGKALEGNVTSLQRYGIHVRKGADETETMANVMEALGKFSGTAEGQVNTFSGAMARLSNAQEDSHKAFGALITDNVAVVDVVKEVTKIFQENTEESKKNAQSYRELVGEGLVVAIEGFKGLVEVADFVGRTVSAGMAAISTAVLDVGGAALRVGGIFSNDFKKQAEVMAEASRLSAQNIGKAFTEDTKLDHVAELLGRVEKAAQTGLAAVKEGATATVDPLNRAKDAVEQLTDAQIALGEAGVKVAERLAGEDPSIKYQKDLEALQAANDQKLELALGYEDALSKLAEERDKKREEQTQKQIDELNAKNDALRSIDASANAVEIAGNQDKINKILSQEDQHSKVYLTQKKKEADSEFKIRQDSAHAISGILGNLAATAQAFGQEGFETFKALAEAQALIDTYASANAAFKSASEIPVIGDVLAPIAAAAAVAAGLANVAKINATHLATGITEIPAGFERDNFPAFLQSGERVVDKDTNKDLKGFLSGSGPMVQLLQSINEKLSQGQAVVVNLDGREIFNNLRGQLQGGRSFA